MIRKINICKKYTNSKHKKSVKTQKEHAFGHARKVGFKKFKLPHLAVVFSPLLWLILH